MRNYEVLNGLAPFASSVQFKFFSLKSLQINPSFTVNQIMKKTYLNKTRRKRRFNKSIICFPKTSKNLVVLMGIGGYL